MICVSTLTVPKCAKGTPVEKCVHEIRGTFPVSGGDRLVAAHFHCHAPTCLEISLYNNRTGALLCTQRPVYGGGRGAFDELGYILQPPCLWGEGQGLEPPPSVGGDGRAQQSTARPAPTQAGGDAQDFRRLQSSEFRHLRGGWVVTGATKTLGNWGLRPRNPALRWLCNNPKTP